MVEVVVVAERVDEDMVLHVECLRGGDISVYTIENGVSIQSADIPSVRLSTLGRASLRIDCSEHGHYAAHLHPITSKAVEEGHAVPTPFLVLEPIQNVEHVRIEGLGMATAIPEIL